MRTILIVFATLLVLLTLLGAFGGSMKYSEPFYVSATNARHEEPFTNMMPSQPHSSFVNSEQMEMSGMPGMPNMSGMPHVSGVDGGASTGADTSEAYENLMVNGQKSQFYEPPSTPSAYHASQNAVEEGFYIEPFEEEKTGGMPAAY